MQQNRPNARVLILFLLVSVISASTAGCGGGSHEHRATEDDGTHNWTILVYMTGDNDLEKYAIQDLNELELTGSDSNVSIIVQIDRAPGYDTTNGNWTTTRRYYVTKDANTSVINSTLIADLGELDMAAPDTLSDFLDWGTANYPADHYVLVLWDHGRGWQTMRTLAMGERAIKAVNMDYTSGSEMSLLELTTALSTRPLDIVILDACLMGMLEVAYSIKDAADIMVASEENVPAPGQPYHAITTEIKASPGITPRTYSSLIVARYVESHATYGSGPVTCSAIDLRTLNTLVDIADRLSSAILDNRDEVRQAVRAAQQQAQYYDSEHQDYESYKDLYDFARLVNELTSVLQVRSAADGVMAAVEDVVIAERHFGAEVTRSHGISIYIPDPGVYSYPYSSVAFAQDTSWDEFLRAY